MKMLFIIGDMGFGGAERTVLYLSSYLADHGDEVVLYPRSEEHTSEPPVT